MTLGSQLCVLVSRGLDRSEFIVSVAAVWGLSCPPRIMSRGCRQGLGHARHSCVSPSVGHRAWAGSVTLPASAPPIPGAWLPKALSPMLCGSNVSSHWTPLMTMTGRTAGSGHPWALLPEEVTQL